LTNPSVGQWPKTQAIKRITRIAVFIGEIVDSVRITYEVENASAPITVQHGGPGGGQATNFEISADEKLVAVYGTRHVNPGPYGDKNIVQLAFIVVDFSGVSPTTLTYVVHAQSTEPTEKFGFPWAPVAASSYTFQPKGAPISYLQAIGFSQVLDQAGVPLI